LPEECTREEETGNNGLTIDLRSVIEGARKGRQRGRKKKDPGRKRRRTYEPGRISKRVIAKLNSQCLYWLEGNTIERQGG